jgi:hypothetical protein
LNKLAHLIAKFASEEPALVLLTLPSALLRFFSQMVSSSIKMKAATPTLTNVETEPSPRREEPVIRHNKRGQRSLTPAKLFDSASMSDDEYKPASEEEEDSDFEVELHVTNTTAIQPKKNIPAKKLRLRRVRRKSTRPRSPWRRKKSRARLEWFGQLERKSLGWTPATSPS